MATETPDMCAHSALSDPEVVSDTYGIAVDTVLDASGVIGDPEDMDGLDNIFDDPYSGIEFLQCDESLCDEYFYDAVEKFRSGQTIAKNARKKFNEVETMATACDIELVEYVESAANGGAEIATHLIAAGEAFEQSAQNQIDNDNDTFERDDDFETGVNEFEEADSVDIPDAREFDDKLTVYSGE